MHKNNYIKDIKDEINDNITRTIGDIDIDILNSNEISAAYYIFPLIERLVLEIYKLLPLVDIEYYQQGTMRTILSMIEKNDIHIFSEELNELLYKYYDEYGVRNILLHVKDTDGIVKFNSDKYNIIELQYMIFELLQILNSFKHKFEEKDFYVDNL